MKTSSTETIVERVVRGGGAWSKNHARGVYPRPYGAKRNQPHPRRALDA